MSRTPRRTRRVSRSRSRSPAVETLGDPLGPAAPQQRAHPRHQFGHRKGLNHIIVRADRQAAHPLGLFAARGQHDHRKGAGAFARPKRRQISRPETPGSIQSRITRSGGVFGEPQLGLVAALDAFSTT